MSKLKLSAIHLLNIKLLILLVIAFALRIYNFEEPFFTTDEVRLSYRGYSLVTTGKDEFGRVIPWIFNSLNDYQLPVSSYVSTFGISMFGKSELGARLPFMLTGLVFILLLYYISKMFSSQPSSWYWSGFIAATSPILIFYSKVPNEVIILAVLILYIFYLLSKGKIRNFELCLLFLVILLASLTSKIAWLILFPFTLYVLIVNRGQFFLQQKQIIISCAFLIPLLVIFLFLQIPQSKRSLMENNFSLFSDVTIKNGINK
ncbi:hypothetical protein C4577_00480, partial [Candidatus Parcubacteria bacterium]